MDASVLVDLLAGTEFAEAARTRLSGTTLHAPAHLDAEVFSALGRLHRAGVLATEKVDVALDRLVAIPLTRHPVHELAAGAWRRRTDLRLVDALYVELAVELHTRVLTTDHRLARACPRAETLS